MYELNKDTNILRNIKLNTFHDCGFKERGDLQEWIVKNPAILGEDLLIIQKEFDDFDDTSERIDLLALDKSGSVVVIENKLDDTGKDVTWQALKYVSYCSTLSKQQIKDIYQSYLDKSSPSENAEENIVEFFRGKPFNEISLNENDQRMILVAGNFRKEVTSTVMWMLNHGVKAQCFKVAPYKYKGEILIDIEQIIPVKEAEDYIIKIAYKTREEKAAEKTNREIEELRREFWGELLTKFNALSSQYKNVNPGRDHWLSSGSGVSGAPFNFIVTKSYVSVALDISKANIEENKKIFDNLFAQKDEIESAYGSKLIWQRLDDKKSSRISEKLFDVDITNRDDWEKIKQFLCDSMVRFEKALKEPLRKASRQK